MSDHQPGYHPNTLQNLIPNPRGKNLNPKNIGKGSHIGPKVFETVGNIEIPTDSKAYKELTLRCPELFPKGKKAKFTLRHLIVMRLYHEALYASNPVPAIREILDREMGKSLQPINAKVEISPLDNLTEAELLNELNNDKEFIASIGVEGIIAAQSSDPQGTH